MSLENAIKQVEWPSADGIYKVVQFYVDGTPYLRFSAHTNTHSNIVATFAQEMKIGLTWATDGEIPYFSDKNRHQIAGAGFCDLNLQEKTAEFYGWSKAYKTGPEKLLLRIDLEHLESIKKMFQDYNISHNSTRTE